MDLLTRLLAHDAWTTRQLLLACQPLPDETLDQRFAIDHGSLRQTFLHMIENTETWTDLICERVVQRRSGDSIAQLLVRLSIISRQFAAISQRIEREKRYNDVFVDTVENPPVIKTFGGAIGHVLTHNMHHRAQIMYLMEQVGIQEHIEGDLLGWESMAFGWH